MIRMIMFFGVVAAVFGVAEDNVIFVVLGLGLLILLALALIIEKIETIIVYIKKIKELR
jgi:hypothetical protein